MGVPLSSRKSVSGHVANCCLALLLSALPITLAQAESSLQDQSPSADSLFSEEGYRLRQYRAPTPDSLSIATTIGSAQLQMMLSVHPNPVLVDVVKVPWRQGRFVDSESHQNIPGSIWLPAAGLGDLPQPWIDYFRDALDQATGGNRRHAVVFYCKADCWLSWNAARRANGFGYKHIYWLRDGVDGWRELGLRLADAEPIAPVGDMVGLQ